MTFFLCFTIVLALLTISNALVIGSDELRNSDVPAECINFRLSYDHFILRFFQNNRRFHVDKELNLGGGYFGEQGIIWFLSRMYEQADKSSEEKYAQKFIDLRAEYEEKLIKTRKEALEEGARKERQRHDSCLALESSEQIFLDAYCIPGEHKYYDVSEEIIRNDRCNRKFDQNTPRELVEHFCTPEEIERIFPVESKNEANVGI